MDDGLSSTAIARKWLIEFWSDCQPHSVREFKAHVQQKNIASIRTTHISSAVYQVAQQGLLERIGRGVYKAEKDLRVHSDFSLEKISGVKYVLQAIRNALLIPINVVELNQKERELLPRLQELYQECESILNDLESEGGKDEPSE